MEIIKTFKSNAEYSKCLICGTEYKKGYNKTHQSYCNCGNIQFDITPDYVRIAIKWTFIKYPTSNNWSKKVLEEIKSNGSPKNALSFSEMSKEEQKQFPEFNSESCLFNLSSMYVDG